MKALKAMDVANLMLHNYSICVTEICRQVKSMANNHSAQGKKSRSLVQSNDFTVFPVSPKEALPRHGTAPIRGSNTQYFQRKANNKKECGLYGHQGARAICSPKTLAFNDVDFKAAVPIDHCPLTNRLNENDLSELSYIPCPQIDPTDFSTLFCYCSNTTSTSMVSQAPGYLAAFYSILKTEGATQISPEPSTRPPRVSMDCSYIP